LIKIKQAHKSFYVGDSEAKPLAKMEFTYAGETLIIIDHTFVADELRGQNVARQLLKELVCWVRSQNKKIVPLCPFAKAEMMKNKEEYADVLHQ